MRRLGLLLWAVGCSGGTTPGGVVVDTGSPGCFGNNGAGVLARLVDQDAQVVFTPHDPGAYTFTAVTFVSGGTVVEETVTEAEAVFRVTPDAEDTALVFSAQLACSSPWADTASPLWTYSVDPGALSEVWSSVMAS
jgi:hypothetical protein